MYRVINALLGFVAGLIVAVSIAAVMNGCS